MHLSSPPTPFKQVPLRIARQLLEQGEVVDTGHWQSLKDVPQTKTIEIRNLILSYEIPEEPGQLLVDIQPNDPWAERQFSERVAGRPVNPGETYRDWPYYKGNVPRHQDASDEEKFSHTYMERFWPKHAGKDKFGGVARRGIRYTLGDYSDLLILLVDHPFTRQAYLPIFFPEDTGAVDQQRIPCTLGYHLMRRGDRLHCLYPMRSCDLLRHFKDDIYMAARLVQHTILQIQAMTDGTDWWTGVKPGTLTFIASSMHVFEPERAILKSMSAALEHEEEKVWGMM